MKTNGFTINCHCEECESTTKQSTCIFKNGLPRSRWSLAMTLGFTFAEVLITLTIIGVIAALTIPNLMRKYDRHISEVKAKQSYNYVTNAIQIKLKESNCPDINCILSENGIAPSSTATNNELLKALKVFFKDAEIDTGMKYAQYYPIYFLDGGKTSLDYFGTPLSYFRLNKKYGLALVRSSFTVNNCSSDNQCLVLFLFSDGGKPKTKAIYNKNVFLLRIKGSGSPRVCYRTERNFYTKQNQYNPRAGFGCDSFCYLLRNNWQMDYLK